MSGKNVMGNREPYLTRGRLLESALLVISDDYNTADNDPGWTSELHDDNFEEAMVQWLEATGYEFRVKPKRLGYPMPNGREYYGKSISI